MAMNGSSSHKRTAQAHGEGSSRTKRKNVAMALEALECPLCFRPLKPPIYQCSVGHLICSACRYKVLLRGKILHRGTKCYLCCDKTSFMRCFGMEDIVRSVRLACINAKDGCTQMVTYYQKEKHEKACSNIPCVCPESGCGFVGRTAALRDHFTTHHNCPSTTFKSSKMVSLRLQPGLHVLRSMDNNHFFLLNMVKETLGHAISVVRVQPNDTEPGFTCYMNYGSSFGIGHQSMSCKIRSSSLSEGLPKGYDLILPKGKVSEEGNSILLETIIRAEYKVYAPNVE